MKPFIKTSKNYKVSVFPDGELMLTDNRNGERNSFLDARNLLEELGNIKSTLERHLLDLVEVETLATAVLSKSGVQS